MTTRVLLAVLIATTACVPRAFTRAVPLVVADSIVDSRTTATVAAYGRLQRALDSKDSMAIAAVLHPELLVVSPTLDTLIGRDGWRYLVELVDDKSRYVRLDPGSFEPCLNGDVYQFNGDYRPRGTSVGVTGKFGILWTEEEGAMRARVVALSWTRENLRKRLPCQFEFHVAATERRLTRTFGVNVNVLDPLITALQGGPQVIHAPELQSAVSLAGAVRYRKTRVVSGELQGEFGLPVSSKHFSPSSGYYSSESVLRAGAAVVLQRQYRPFRFGVGPAFRITRRAEVLERRAPGPGPDLSFHKTSWSPALGAVAEVVRVVPITRTWSADLTMRFALYTKNRSSSSTSNMALNVGATLGRGWH